jgi:hypothetical protein
MSFWICSRSLIANPLVLVFQTFQCDTSNDNCVIMIASVPFMIRDFAQRIAPKVEQATSATSDYS